jgi:hypothetical protein
MIDPLEPQLVLYEICLVSVRVADQLRHDVVVCVARFALRTS